jgi:hypothetical protein
MDTMEFLATINGTKMKVTGNSHEELLKRWMQLVVSANPSIPVDSTYWMQRIKSYSITYSRESLMKKPSIKLADVWNAGLAILKQGQGETVTQQEHLRRDRICAACPMRTNVSICMSCGGAGKISRLIGSIRQHIKGTIKIDEKIKKSYCKVCGCAIPLLSITRYENLPNEDPEKNFARPSICWMKKTSPNYKP